MKLAFLILLFSFSLNGFAQVNFFQTGAKWGYNIVETIEFPGAGHREWLHQYELVSDTVINSVIYRTLNDHVKYTIYPSNSGQPTWSYYDQTGFVRYDSSTQKVLSHGSPDFLLFDFSLTLGDTIPNTDPAAFGLQYIIDSIETINLFGHQLKKFYYSNNNSFDPNQYILEGIGASNGLTLIQPPYISVSSRIVSNLICFQLNSDVYPSGSLCDVFTSIDQYEKSNSPFLHSTSTGNSFKVNIVNSTDGFLEIYDMMGRKIYSKNVTNDEVIYVGESNGVLNARLTVEGRMRTCRVIGK